MESKWGQMSTMIKIEHNVILHTFHGFDVDLGGKMLVTSSIIDNGVLQFSP